MNKHTAALLEAHFDTAFAAPEGVQKLRELILTLAMQGKLVPQNPHDQPASELLEEIKVEKKRLAKEGKIKTPKQLPPVIAEQTPYGLPQGWEWVRLGNIGNVFNGNSINASEKDAKYAGAKGLPYIATKDVGYGLDPLDYENGICIPLNEGKFRVAHAGAVLICAEGGSAGKKCGLTERDICFGNKLFANELFGKIPSRFILFAYLSPFFAKSFADSMTGIIGGVSIAKFLEILIPLPPLAEQRRIVAKIDELMVRCDALENLRTEREEKQLAVHAAAIKQLLNIAAPDEHQRAHAFLAEHFGELYTVKENVAELRKAILQLAVMGKLVPQDPCDMPGDQVIREIQANKVQRGKGGALKKAKPLSKPAPNELPFSLPESWLWVRIGDIAEAIDYGTSQKTVEDPTLVPVYRMGNIVDGRLIDSGFKYLPATIDDLPKLYLKQNDILFNRTNSYELVGKTALYTGQNDRATFASYLIRIRFNDKYLQPKFFSFAMNAPYFRMTQIEPEIVQQCGQANFNGTKLSLCLVPLPPQNEQDRIVKKIEHLMVLCESLEQRIAATSCRKTKLLKIFMAQV